MSVVVVVVESVEVEVEEAATVVSCAGDWLRRTVVCSFACVSTWQCIGDGGGRLRANWAAAALAYKSAAAHTNAKVRQRAGGECVVL